MSGFSSSYFTEISCDPFIDDLIIHVDLLMDLAKKYSEEYNKNLSTLDLNWYVAMYIRQSGGNYITGSWPSVGGAVDKNFVDYVNNSNGEISKYFEDNAIVYDRLGKPIDVQHFAATLSAIYYESDFSTGYQTGLMPEKHLNNLAGWAGDLQTLVRDVLRETNDSKDADTLKRTMISLFGDSSYSYGFEDWYADVDAVNIANKSKNEELPNVMENYYNNGIDKRFTSFASNITGKTNPSTKDIYNTVKTYTDQSYFVVKWPLYEGGNVAVENDQSKTFADTFTLIITTYMDGEK